MEKEDIYMNIFDNNNFFKFKDLYDKYEIIVKEEYKQLVDTNDMEIDWYRGKNIYLDRTMRANNKDFKKCIYNNGNNAVIAKYKIIEHTQYYNIVYNKQILLITDYIPIVAIKNTSVMHVNEKKEIDWLYGKVLFDKFLNVTVETTTSGLYMIKLDNGICEYEIEDKLDNYFGNHNPDN